MFGRWFGKKSAPLSGAPQLRRQKTYSAQSGYVYQYFYQGQRAVGGDRERAIEYVFDVSADRKKSAPVSVIVSEEALENWQQRHGRDLRSNERYAIAKIALFQAFDERENPSLMKLPVHVRTADVEAILAVLEIE